MANRFNKVGAEDDAVGSGLLKMNKAESADKSKPDVESAVARLTASGWDMSVPFKVETRTDRKGNEFTCLVPEDVTLDLDDATGMAEAATEVAPVAKKPSKKKASKKEEPVEETPAVSEDSEDPKV